MNQLSPRWRLPLSSSLLIISVVVEVHLMNSFRRKKNRCPLSEIKPKGRVSEFKARQDVEPETNRSGRPVVLVKFACPLDLLLRAHGTAGCPEGVAVPPLGPCRDTGIKKG